MGLIEEIRAILDKSEEIEDSEKVKGDSQENNKSEEGVSPDKDKVSGEKKENDLEEIDGKQKDSDNKGEEEERDEREEIINEKDREIIEELEMSKEEIEEYKAIKEVLKDKDIKEVIGELEELREKYESKLEKIKTEHTIEMALLNSKAKNVKAVRALMDIKDGVNSEEDIKEEIERIKKNDPYLFETKDGTLGGVGNFKKADIKKEEEDNIGKRLAKM